MYVYFFTNPASSPFKAGFVSVISEHFIKNVGRKTEGLTAGAGSKGERGLPDHHGDPGVNYGRRFSGVGAEKGWRVIIGSV